MTFHRTRLQRALGAVALTVAAIGPGAPAVAGHPSSAAATAGGDAACERPTRLRFSLIPQGDLARDLKELRPLFDDLEQALGMPVETYLPSSYGAVGEALLSGAVHVARLGPASYALAKRENPGLTPFATYATRANAYEPAGAYYHALLIARQADDAPTLAALRGTTLALVDPESTSGAVIPKYVFPEVVGTSVERYFGQVVYTGSHQRSVEQVAEGRVAAAFVASANLAAAVAANPDWKPRIRVLWRSAPIPRDPFVYRGQLCGDIKEKIRAVFLGRNAPNQAQLLRNLDASRFVPVQDADYQLIRQLY